MFLRQNKWFTPRSEFQFLALRTKTIHGFSSFKNSLKFQSHHIAFPFACLVLANSHKEYEVVLRKTKQSC